MEKTKPRAAAGQAAASGRQRSRRSFPAVFPLRALPTEEALEAASRRHPELDAAAVTGYLALLRLSSDVLSAMEAHLARHGLSKGRFSVLMLLWREGGTPVRPSDLATRAGVTRATITGLVDGLEREGLVRREPHQVDARVLGVSLTARGGRLLEEILPAHFRRIAALMTHLSPEEKRLLIGLVRRIEQGLPALREP